MISITLPSLSDEASERAVRNICETASLPCEIIIVSPAYPRAFTFNCNVVWVEDRALAGANAAHELGFEQATGEYVLAWVDDHVLRKGWDVAAINRLRNLESLRPGRPNAVGLRHVTGQVGFCFGLYYPYFPMMRRAAVEQVCGWLSGEYRLGFADIDLAMRIYASGGQCLWTISGFVDKLPADDRKLGKLHQDAHTTPDDLALFLDRWGKTLGAGWPTGHLRDFNIDRILTP